MMVLGSSIGEQGGCGVQKFIEVIVIHEATSAHGPNINSLMYVNC
jgi:hypothetical protein